MNPTTGFFIDLLVLLAGAIVAGELVRRATGLPALVGQLLVGVLLGPSLLGLYIGLTALTPELTAIQLLGTVLILFMAGLDTVPEQILRMGPQTVAMGVAVFAVPFALLTVLAHALLPAQSGLVPLFVGLTLSITALPVMGIMLVEFRLTKTRIGNLLVNTALVNELTAVTVFAALLQLQNGDNGSGVAIVIAALSVAVFLAAIATIYRVVRLLNATPWWPAARERMSNSLLTKEAGFAILMAALIGASLFSSTSVSPTWSERSTPGILVSGGATGRSGRPQVSGVFDTMTWGFFVPLFFAFVGVEMDIWSLATPTVLLVFIGISVAAVTTKVGTGFAIARFYGWSGSDSFAIGSLVSSRGAVELAMAVILLGEGIVTLQLFTLVAAVGLVTTIIAPLGAMWAWRSARRAGGEAPRGPERVTAADLGGLLPFPLVPGGALDSTEGREMRPDPVRPLARRAAGARPGPAVGSPVGPDPDPVGPGGLLAGGQGAPREEHGDDEHRHAPGEQAEEVDRRVGYG